eukprot:1160495-Pelagomonas_calceolata.AAC.19
MRLRLEQAFAGCVQDAVMSLFQLLEARKCEERCGIALYWGEVVDGNQYNCHPKGKCSQGWATNVPRTGQKYPSQNP